MRAEHAQQLAPPPGPPGRARLAQQGGAGSHVGTGASLMKVEA